MTNIWLDDLRDPHQEPWKKMLPDGEPVLWVKNREEFQAAVEQLGNPNSGQQIHQIWFDNDLGEGHPKWKGKHEGRHCFSWFETHVRSQNWLPIMLRSQSMNPAARQELLNGFGALERWWDKMYPSNNNPIPSW
jgi:hypothetical protein